MLILPTPALLDAP